MRYLIRHTYQCKRGRGPVYLKNLKVLLNILRGKGMSGIKVCVDVFLGVFACVHTVVPKVRTSERATPINPLFIGLSLTRARLQSDCPVMIQ